MSARLERWRTGDAPAELQRLLSSADVDHPSADQLARLSTKLEASIGADWSGGEPSTEILQPSASATGGAAGSSIGPVLAVTTALVLGLSAAYFGLRPAPNAPPRLAERARAPIARAEHAVPPAAPIAPVAVPSPEPLAASGEVVPARPAAKPAAPTRAARSEARSGGLGEELKQLEAIRRTLARDPGRALAATDRHARRFPQGALGPERELLRIEALLRLGKQPEARQLASRALANNHPYRAQILQLMAAEKR